MKRTLTLDDLSLKLTGIPARVRGDPLILAYCAGVCPVTERLLILLR